MEIRFNLDPETGQPHIYDHGVTEDEVRQVLRNVGNDFKSGRRSRIALGQTAAGRYLQVVYVPGKRSDSVFVVTAYDLTGPALKAYRRRRRRRHR